MENINELFGQATKYHQNNQLDIAKQFYQRILQLSPEHPDALHLLGVVNSQQGNYQEAISLINQAIKINRHPMYFNNLGESFRLIGLFEKAEESFYQAIGLAPGFAEAYFNLANVLKLEGKINEAINNYNMAVNINPNHFRALFNLGNLMLEYNNFESAINYYDQVLRLNPNFPEAFNNRQIATNNIQTEKNKFQEEVYKYNQAIKMNPSDHSNYFELGKIFFNNNDYEQTIKNYSLALNINGNQLEIYNDLLLIYSKLNNWEKIIETCKKIINLSPDNKQIYEKMATAFEKTGNIEEARNIYYEWLKFEPENTLLKLYADTLDAPISYNSQEIIEYQKTLNERVDKYIGNNFKTELENLHKTNLRIPLSLIYQGKDDIKLREKYARLFENKFENKLLRNSNQKPCIAFVVTNGHEGIFMTCMKGIINRLPTNKFDITIIASKQSQREIIKPNIKNSNIKFIDLPDRIDLAVKVISEESFDLIYYWEIGTDTINYFLPFFRLAPIQCTSYGWPVTSGINNADYYITSRMMATEETEKQFSEKVVYIDSLLAYYFRTPLPNHFKPKENFGFSSSDKIYICTQNLRKIHPDFDFITLEILKRDPQAIYLLFEDHDPSVTELLKQRLKISHGEFYKRIRFYPRIMSGPDYINIVKISDVMLDTLYFGGVNTVYDALSIGIPVITLPSELQRGRYTYAMYKRMGITECIVNSEKEYIELAIKIANDSIYRYKLSNQILEKSHLLFEDHNAVDQMAELFEKLIKENTYKNN